MVRYILDNYYNYVLFSAIISWISAQVLKTLLNFIIDKELNLERLVGPGGMPSAHSAFVCSATLAVSRKIGIQSTEFAIIFIIAMVVMYDAMGIRRAAGMHAKKINEMNKILEKNPDSPKKNNNKYKHKNKELKEVLGHTPFEVLGGALLGIIIALIVPVK